MLSFAALRRHAPTMMTLARREIGPIVIVALVGALMLIFRHIAEEVGEGDTRTFDRAIIYALRTPGDPHRPIGPDWLNTAALDVTSLGSITVLVILTVLACGLFLSIKHWRQALLLLIASSGGIIITDLLKDVFERERPPVLLHAAPAIGTSFPSGHATLSATVYLTLGALIAHFAGRRRIRVYALTAAVALSVMVGCSRVYLGVHWPTDVLAGWCVGAAWALVWWGVALGWERAIHHRLDSKPRAHPQPVDAGLVAEGS